MKALFSRARASSNSFISVLLLTLLLSACGGGGGGGDTTGTNTPATGADTTFGTSGKVAFDGGGNEYGNGIVEDVNGDLLVVATHQPLGSSNAAILKYDSDGNPDATFNNDGFVATDGRGAGFGNGIVLDANGKILITGTVSLALNGYLPNVDERIEVALWRFNADGSPDTDFGTVGRALATLRSGVNEAMRGEAIAVDSQGRIVVAGTHSRGTLTTYVDLKIWRFNADGSMDGAFNVTLLSFGANIFVDNMILDADNNIYVVGSTSFAGGAGLDPSTNPVVFKYTEAGFADDRFGNAGVIAIPAPGTGNYGHDMAFDSKGNILVSGTRNDENNPGVKGMAVWRLDSSGMLDPGFGNAGVTVVYEGTESVGRGIYIDADDVIYVTGSSNGNTDVADDGAKVWRLTAEGALDTAYGTDGVVALESDALAAGNRIIETMDGKIVIVGKTRDSNYDVALWKLN